MSDIDKNKAIGNNILDTLKEKAFNDETVQALHEFGEVLQRIHNRLVAEGIPIELDSHYASQDRNN